MSRRRSRRDTDPAPEVEGPVTRTAGLPAFPIVEPRTSVDTSTWCEGPCNRAARKQLRDLAVDKPVEGNTLAGQPFWCPVCHATLTRALRDLPDLLAHLVTAEDGRLAPSAPVTGGRTSHTHAPSPSPAFDLLDEATNWIHAWVILYADHTGDTNPDLMPRDQAGIVHPTVTGSVTYLMHHATQLWASPVGHDFGQELLAETARITKAIGLDEPVQRLSGEACPSCDRKALIRRDGSARIECRHCHADWDESAYDHLALTLTQEQA